MVGVFEATVASMKRQIKPNVSSSQSKTCFLSCFFVRSTRLAIWIIIVVTITSLNKKETRYTRVENEGLFFLLLSIAFGLN